MASVTLRPSGDGTTTGWTRVAASGTFASKIVDDPDSHDSDTSYVQSPNAADGTMFVELDDVPSDFNPNSINSITIKVAHRRLNTPQMNVDSGTVNARLTRSDETTAISTTPTAVNSPIQAGYQLDSFTPSPTGSHTVTDWNGARLALVFDHTTQQTVDTTNQIRITAVEVVIDYNSASSPTVGALALSGVAPTLSVSDHRTITTVAGSLRIDGQGNHEVRPPAGEVFFGLDHPSAGALAFSGVAPTVQVSGGLSVSPPVGTAVLTGIAGRWNIGVIVPTEIDA